MAGFPNIKAWPDAEDAGQSWITGFRKAASSVATTTSAWADYSYYAGSPPANFYASTPLEAATVEASRGIYVPSVSPARQFLRNLKVMSAAVMPGKALPNLNTGFIPSTKTSRRRSAGRSMSLRQSFSLPTSPCRQASCQFAPLGTLWLNFNSVPMKQNASAARN